MPSDILSMIPGIQYILAVVVASIMAYLVLKARNLATKEDITEITTKVEQVKHTFTSEIEKLKASLLIQVHSHKLFVEKRMELFLELWLKMRDSQGAAYEILALYKFDTDVPGFPERLKRLEIGWEHALKEFRKAKELSAPFLPQELSRLLIQFDSEQTLFVKLGINELSLYEARSIDHKEFMRKLETKWRELALAFGKSGSTMFELFRHMGDENKS